jgi:hypothetical protein
MQKKAKNIIVGDIIINDYGNILVQQIIRSEYTIQVLGFVGDSTELSDVFFGYSDLVTVHVDKKVSLIDKLLELFKCHIS